jgi:ribosome maturation factor RimP
MFSFYIKQNVYNSLKFKRNRAIFKSCGERREALTFFCFWILDMTLDITNQIKELAAPLAEERGLFVVDIELKTGSGNELWVYLDAEDRGINLDECAEISRELGFVIDAHELLESKYRLNISSPGLSRPLSDARQYSKNIGRMIKLRYWEGDETKRIKGMLEQASHQKLTVIETEGKKSTEHFIQMDTVIEAKIVPQI